jgi:hypothetical protein
VEPAAVLWVIFGDLFKCRLDLGLPALCREWVACPTSRWPVLAISISATLNLEQEATLAELCELP